MRGDKERRRKKSSADKKSKEAWKSKKADNLIMKRKRKVLEKESEVEAGTVDQISSVDEDCSRGMKDKKSKGLRKSKKEDHLRMKRKRKVLEKESEVEEGKVYQISWMNEDCSGGIETVGKVSGGYERDSNQSDEIQSKENNLESVGANNRIGIRKNISKESTKRKRKDAMKEKRKLMEKESEVLEKVDHISLVDEDCSKGMKKWLAEYHYRIPGQEILQQRVDAFIIEHEAKEEQARKEREAQAAEGGWTVVVQHKGRKKTTDSETGVVVGSVSQAAVEDKLAKKKNKDVALDFYKFQRREARRNELMQLQSKFEQDKKRIQQMRAARKFRPY